MFLMMNINVAIISMVNRSRDDRVMIDDKNQVILTTEAYEKLKLGTMLFFNLFEILMCRM